MKEDNSDEISKEEIEEEEESNNNSNNEKETESDKKDKEKISEEELNIFNNKLHSIQKGINTLKSKFSSLIENIKKDDYELQYGLSFFESKQDMMNIYITNLLQYCYTKICATQPISGMPLVSDNIKISSLIERVKVIEMKLQHLINKTINTTNKDNNNMQLTNEMDLKPKILSVYNNEENEEENESDDDNENKKEKKAKNKKMKTYMEKSELYKLKNKDVDFYETKAEQKNRKRQLERGKEKIRNSEMMRDLKNEISDKPINFDNNSNSYLNKYMKEVEKYEKDHFVNITVPKKIIKQLKRKDDNVDDLYKLDTNLKILSNTLNDNYDKNKNKNSKADKNKKKFLNKKRRH